MQTQKHFLNTHFFQYQKTQKTPIMNIIFDLSGVIFDNAITYSQAHPHGAKLLSPINPGTTIRLLNDCIKEGHRLFSISNMSQEDILYLNHNAQAARIFKCFEDIILGPVVGIKKPDPRIFKHLLTKHVLDAEHSIFIDDQIVNLEAAEKAGISKGIHCNNFNFTEIRKKLESYGAL